MASCRAALSGNCIVNCHFLVLYFLFRQLPSQLNQNLAHVMKWIRFENMCLKFGVRCRFSKTWELELPVFGVFLRLGNLTSTLTANFFRRKRDTDNQGKSWNRRKNSWTLVHKRFTIGSEFSPTFRKFCIVLSTRCTRKPNPTKRGEINGADANRIRWRWILNVNVTIEIRSLVSEARKHFELTIASRRAAFSGNTSLIATFSSFYL